MLADAVLVVTLPAMPNPTKSKTGISFLDLWMLALTCAASASVFAILDASPMVTREAVAVLCATTFLLLHFGRDNKFRKIWYLLAAGLSIFVVLVCYRAGTNLAKERTDRAFIRGALSTLLGDAEHLQEECGHQDKPVPVADIKNWKSFVDDFLKRLGPEYQVRFWVSAPINPVIGLDSAHASCWSEFQAHEEVLGRFMEDFRENGDSH
jgi:hypothetical protein